MLKAAKIVAFVIFLVIAWFGSSYFFTFQLYKVKAEPTPVSRGAEISSGSWVSTWGGEDFFSGCGNCGAWYDTCNDVVVDDAGYIYVTGRSRETYYPDATGAAYLTKFDSAANVVWRHQWAGGAGEGLKLNYDPNGSIIVAGTYSGTADLDPGPDEEKFSSVGGNDLFLIKFNLDGDYQWGVTWGGHDSPDALEQESVTALGRDSQGNIYVSGGYYGACDFNPYIGIAFHTSAQCSTDYSDYMRNTEDMYLSSFTSDGNFRWVRVWPCESLWEKTTDLAIDDNDNLYITGSSMGEIDMDPGKHRHIIRPVGDCDAFLLKLDSEGSFKWVRAWGGSLRDNANGVAFNDGLLYVIGDFGSQTQFDPGPGTMFGTSTGEKDTFLSVFDTDGIFQWVKTWGGNDSGYWYSDSGTDIVVAEDGLIYITGVFPDILDFTSDLGEKFSASGTLDTYVLVLDGNGTCTNMYTWGGEGNTRGGTFALDKYWNMYIVGEFETSFEFIDGDTILSASQVAPLGEYSMMSSDSFLLKINMDDAN